MYTSNSYTKAHNDKATCYHNNTMCGCNITNLHKIRCTVPRSAVPSQSRPLPRCPGIL